MKPLPTFTPIETLVREVEQYVAQGGWDQPTRLFVVANTAQAIANDPGLKDILPPEAVQQAAENPDTLTAIEQDGLPDHQNLEELLGHIYFGPAAAGAAIVVERLTVPPEAQVGLPEDPQAAAQALLDHPDRKDIRLVAAVLRDGDHLCAVRSRTNDSPEMVSTGKDLVPGLIAGLSQTLQEPPNAPTDAPTDA